MSNITESTQDQQNDSIDQQHLDADKGGELENATIPEEVAAVEYSSTLEPEDVPADSALQLVADNVDAKKGASKPKASKRTPLAFQLQELKLGAIYGEHPLGGQGP